MNTFFPVTHSINKDSDLIIQSINARFEEVKNSVESQSPLKKITIFAIEVLSIGAGIVTLASGAVAALTLSITVLTIAAVALATTITSIVLSMFMNPRTPGEAIIKNCWESLFNALRAGNGEEIIERCKEVAKQKRTRTTSFNHCISNDISPFLQKVCVVGYLRIAMDHLHNGDDEQAKTNAQYALQAIRGSGFSDEVANFAKTIISSPAKIRHLIEKHHVGNDLHAIDYLIVLNRNLNLL